MAQEKRGRDDRQNREERDSEFVDKLVAINRVAKVVKGGRRFGFAALVVVGDQKGRVGFGHGKAREVPEAIRKATEAAKRDLIFVPLRSGRTLHHDVHGRHGAGKVLLRSAKAVTFALPKVSVNAWICRLIFDSATLSKSIIVIWPMALRANASTIHEPTPPTPITQTCAALNRSSAAAP